MYTLPKLISCSTGVRIDHVNVELFKSNRLSRVRWQPVAPPIDELDYIHAQTIENGRACFVNFIKSTLTSGETFISKEDSLKRLIEFFDQKTELKDKELLRLHFLGLDPSTDSNLSAIQFFFMTHDSHSVMISSKGTLFFMMNRFNEKELSFYKVPFKENEPVTLGLGKNGKIRLALNLETGNLHTVKKVSGIRHPDTGKTTSYDPRIVDAAIVEAKFHISMSQKQMVRIIKADDYGEKIQSMSKKSYLIMPYSPSLNGVDFCNRMDTNYSQNAISVSELKYLRRHVARELIFGVKELHERGVSHGDIKLDNTLINNKGDFQFIDFGTATRAKTRRDIVGTKGIMAPEIGGKNILGRVNAYNTKQADIYALGKTLQTIVDNTLKEPIVGCFGTVQMFVVIQSEPLLSDLINQLSCINPKKRLSLEKALTHPYFSKDTPIYKNKVADIMEKLS